MINIKETKKEFILELLNKDIYKVLDLGCGEMLLSKAFLKNNSFVKGIDIKEPLEIPEGAVFVKGNFFQEEFDKDYDLIIASLILHLTKKEFTPKLIKKIQDSTAKNGYNFLILLSNKDSLSTEERFYPSMSEIMEFYPGSEWKLIKSLEDETEPEQHGNAQTPDNIPHTHHLIFAIFQKQ